MDKRKTRRAGFYWNESNTPFASVTNILKIIDKSALRYWFGKQVYYAVAKDPGINEQEALAAPWKVSNKAKARGTLVHSIVESYKQTKDVITGVPKEYQGYTLAFKKWVKEFSPTIGDVEKTVYNDEFKYAGTLDMLAVLDGDNLVIDVKTGKGIYPEAFLQTSAYLHGDGIEAEGTAVLLLKENGSYAFERGDDEFDYFLAAKKLWEWQNKDLLQDINYWR